MMPHVLALLFVVQPAPESPAAPPPAPAEDPAAAKARVEQVAEDIPDEEKVARTGELLTAMNGMLDKVIKHLEEAREQKDIVKLNCVNEKLTTIKGLLKISEQAQVALKEAAARKDHGGAVHEYSKITISHQKCEQLLAETEACVGELAVYAGDTEVEVEITEDTSYGPANMIDSISAPPIWERPPTASPFQ